MYDLMTPMRKILKSQAFEVHASFIRQVHTELFLGSETTGD